VIAIQRASRYVASPGVDLRLEDGDILYLLGEAGDVLLARRRLTTG
jgi:K+/H+ antiporter YhaU regulatory subunit KhtT